MRIRVILLSLANHFHVNVLVKPGNIVVTNQNSNYKLDSKVTSVTLTCSATGQLPVKIVWFVKTDTLNDTINSNSLPVTKRYAGPAEFRCLAENIHGNTTTPWFNATIFGEFD